jgi:hypothetical protein
MSELFFVVVSFECFHLSLALSDDARKKTHAHKIKGIKCFFCEAQ